MRREWKHTGKHGWRFRFQEHDVPKGPWDDEPDKVQWVDPTTGLDCLMHRNHMGAWCGYVGVPEGHKFYGVGYSECSLKSPCQPRKTYSQLADELEAAGNSDPSFQKLHESSIAMYRTDPMKDRTVAEYCDHTPGDAVHVHGGLTYAGLCQDTKDESKGICHVPEPGRPEEVWWLGFDCGHAWDLVPAMQSFNEKFRQENPEEYNNYRPNETYRDQAFVEAEVTRLAAQLAAL